MISKNSAEPFFAGLLTKQINVTTARGGGLTPA